MQMLDNFKSLKLHWDHSFYKAIILPQLPEDNSEKQDLKSFGYQPTTEGICKMAGNLAREDVDSIIEPTC